MLTLPVALPLWIGFLALLAVALSLRALARPIVTFWTAPPRRRGGYYGRYCSLSDDDVLIVLAERKAA